MRGVVQAEISEAAEEVAARSLVESLTSLCRLRHRRRRLLLHRPRRSGGNARLRRANRRVVPLDWSDELTERASVLDDGGLDAQVALAQIRERARCEASR